METDPLLEPGTFRDQLKIRKKNLEKKAEEMLGALEKEGGLPAVDRTRLVMNNMIHRLLWNEKMDDQQVLGKIVEAIGFIHEKGMDVFVNQTLSESSAVSRKRNPAS